MVNKKELRALVREKKRAMTAGEIEEKSRLLGEKFRESDAYQKAKTIYGYLPYNQEVRTVAILAQALADGKQVAVPKVYGEDMKFILLPDLTRVSKGYAGIPEPIDDGPVATDTQALVLMPGLVFDKAGHRIGYGGGYYDRFMAREPGHETLGLAYDFQVISRLPVEEYDLPVGRILTTSGLVKCGSGPEIDLKR